MDREQIKRVVAKWLNEGVPLPQVQTRLQEEHQVTMTYFELRMLASEIDNIDWSKQEKQEPAKKTTPAAADKRKSAKPATKDKRGAAAPAKGAAHEDAEDVEYIDDEDGEDDACGGGNMFGSPAGQAGRTKVELSPVMRPGTLASGTVRFGSGITANWVLDQFGRLGLENYSGKPTPKDLQEFQIELQKVLQGVAM